MARPLAFHQKATWDLLVRRFFFCQSFEIHGGCGGLFDYGPPGCAVKSNIIQLWRQHFVLEENMLEVDCSCLTPEKVFVASGHAEKFNDVMTQDVKTNQCFRADNLIKEVLRARMAKGCTPEETQAYELTLHEIDNYGAEELYQKLQQFNIKSPETGNELGKTFEFNLMFGTRIGPMVTSENLGFLRPETAQGIFVNFRRLLDFNGGRIPMSVSQIGQAFRNEISPRMGLIRVREFTMCEIEHFVHPDRKQHPKFASVADIGVTLLSADRQLAHQPAEEMTFGQAVRDHIIDNETLAYFMARTQLFLLRVGIRREGLRFRKHLPKEKAHYARECWDAEILCSYDWVECVGHADREAYDLNAHQTATRVDMQAYETFPSPITEVVTTITPVMGVIGRTLRGDAKAVQDYLAGLSNADAERLKAQFESGDWTLKLCDRQITLAPNMVKIETGPQTISGRRYHPCVIEPSFGIGRIMYCLFEHSFYSREADAQRCVLAFNPAVAPVKCSVLPLSSNDSLLPFVSQLSSALTSNGLSCKVDDSGAPIGRRYARTDEIGIPFALTIDFQTVVDNTVTLRERDSCQQIRGSIADLVNEVRRMVDHGTTWAELYASGRFPVVTPPAEEPETTPAPAAAGAKAAPAPGAAKKK
eukprot:gnl/Spiro4/24692_TR12256_c0_g1_i1.p1 gnl/Spiro4/24692_TR12256_c0_g1~~gnl/Spiro4/24692_TR12256_c0_g1_i1.p1  ORF type:complete len:645 (+),score=172.34 gnl/Spiro4/24692_TR12256_c0_g1_i1:74-2008(+)